MSLGDKLLAEILFQQVHQLNHIGVVVDVAGDEDDDADVEANDNNFDDNNVDNDALLHNGKFVWWLETFCKYIVTFSRKDSADRDTTEADDDDDDLGFRME